MASAIESRLSSLALNLSERLRGLGYCLISSDRCLYRGTGCLCVDESRSKICGLCGLALLVYHHRRRLVGLSLYQSLLQSPHLQLALFHPVSRPELTLVPVPPALTLPRNEHANLARRLVVSRTTAHSTPNQTAGNRPRTSLAVDVSLLRRLATQLSL